MKVFKTFLYIINGLLYFVTLALWIMLSSELTLNLAVSFVTLSLTLLLLLSDKEKLSKYYKSRWFKNFTSSLIASFLLFCILSLVNYLFYKHPVSFDLTQDRLNSLTKQSEVVLRGLKAEVKIKVFARKEELPLYASLLDLYKHVKSDLNYELIDMDLHPEGLASYGISKPGTLVLEMNDKRQIVSEGEELAITNALIRLSRNKDPLILVSQGHGEMEIDPSKKEGMGDFIALAQSAYFHFEGKNLAQMKEIPLDYDALLLWGPKRAFLDQEISLIEDYLKRGGKLLIALDPNLNKDEVQNLRSFLSQKGIELKNSLVVDQVHFVNGSKGTVPLIKEFDKAQDLFKNFEGPLFFPLVSQVSRQEKALTEGRSLELYLNTTPFPASWADTNPREFVSGKINFHEKEDAKGPVSLMGLYQDKNTKEKIAVFGNSTFVSNRYFKFGQNQILLMNTLSWLSDEDQIGAFNLPTGRDEPIFIGSTQMGVIFYFSVIFVPLVLFLLAFYLYWRRRKL